MVTKPKPRKRRLFMKEHREARGISAAAMGDKLGIERESVYRLEREQWRMDPDKQADYAHALGLEPEDLWKPPGTISIDAMLSSAPDDLRNMAADIVRRLVEGRR
jgi:DNA-binding XRE family transcriptional regulator